MNIHNYLRSSEWWAGQLENISSKASVFQEAAAWVFGAGPALASSTQFGRLRVGPSLLCTLKSRHQHSSCCLLLQPARRYLWKLMSYAWCHWTCLILGAGWTLQVLLGTHRSSYFGVRLGGSREGSPVKLTRPRHPKVRPNYAYVVYQPKPALTWGGRINFFKPESKCSLNLANPFWFSDHNHPSTNSVPPVFF